MEFSLIPNILCLSGFQFGYCSHLDWRVLKKQLYVGEEHRPLPGRYAIIREDRWHGNEESIFGTVGKEYTPLQNTEAFGFFDLIVKTGSAFYDSAGALRNGERVWVMARLRGDFEVTPNDNIARYLLLSNTHDGTGSVQVKFTPVRVVCKNTLNQALGNGPAIRVAHTRHMQMRLGDTANAVLASIQRHFDDLGKRFQAMLRVQMSEVGVRTYLKSVFHDPAAGKDEMQYKRALSNVQRNRLEAARLFTEGRGNDLNAVRGTLWAAYNGVTEYVDFHRTTCGDGKWLENIWFGAANGIKERALEEALTIVHSG